VALYPEAKRTERKAGILRRLLPESRTQGRIWPRVVIMHSAAGRGSLYNFFLRSSNLESHFWVGTDGTVEQYIDTNVRADANNKANGFAISIETESSRSATEPWPPAQFEAIINLVRWCCDTHGIPKIKCPRWDGTGIGWHIQFGAPGPWTPVAKSCPGPARIRQMPTLIAAVAQGPAADPVEPNAGRYYRTFVAGANDRTIYKLGGRDNQVAELQLLTGNRVTGIYDEATVRTVVALKTKANWLTASGTPDRTSRVDERLITAISALAAKK